MKILLLGKNGQVGWELQRALAPLGDVVALDLDSPGDLQADFSRPESLARTVRLVAPQVIVNAAAHTAVDKAESEPELARRGLGRIADTEQVRQHVAGSYGLVERHDDPRIRDLIARLRQAAARVLRPYEEFSGDRPAGSPAPSAPRLPRAPGSAQSR